MKLIACATCGENRIRYRSRRCQECFLAHQRAERARLRGVHSCVDCGACFVPYHRANIYCATCSGSRFGFKGAPRKSAATLTARCRLCATEFTQPRRYYLKRSCPRIPRFCSPKCNYSYKRGLRGYPVQLFDKCWRVASAEARRLGYGKCCICSSPDIRRDHKQISVDHIVPRRLMAREERGC